MSSCELQACCSVGKQITFTFTFTRCANHRCTGHATMSTECGNDRLITVHAPFLAFPPNQKSLSKMAVNGVGCKFENDLQKALEGSLALFPVDELKVEERHIIEKIVARRDFVGNCW